MNVLFIAGIAVVAPDPAKSRELFVGALGLPLEANPGYDYFHSERIGGSKHFGVWPLSQAAQACFGSDEWPAERPVPQVSIEFEVESAGAVADGAAELSDRGFELLHGAPVHLGAPELIGIADLSRPDYGEAVPINHDEIPVFWACGVTPQSVVERVKPEFCVTHYPGCMLVTDRRNSELSLMGK